MKSIRRIKHNYLITIGCIGVAMILIAGWIFSKAIPSTEAVRLRNALLAEVGNQADFNWLPGNIPPSFHQENVSGVNEFSTYLSEQPGRISGITELDKSLAIARFLLSNDDPKGVAIMSNTSEALRSIVEKGTGYCADYTQVFNAAAYLNNIPVREWGLSFDGFGGDGHAVSEIFDQNLKKWVLVDTFNGFYLIDQETHIPLSVMEFQRLLQTHSLATVEKKLKVIKIKPNRFGFLNETKLFQYFSRGKDHFYLWWGNDSLRYDENLLVTWASKLSRYTEQLVAIAMGVHQNIRLLPNKANMDDIAALIELRTQLLIAFLLETTLGILLASICLRTFVNRIKKR